MAQNCYLKPAATYNGCVKSDLPLVVTDRKRRRSVEAVRPGQLLCVGKVYLKTDRGLVRLK
jgi:hypothetical protein